MKKPAGLDPVPSRFSRRYFDTIFLSLLLRVYMVAMIGYSLSVGLPLIYDCITTRRRDHVEFERTGSKMF